MQLIVNEVIIKNYGISFGQSFPGLTIVSGILLGILVRMARKEKKLSLWLAVLGGGLNFGERLYFGYVRDYWKIPLIPLYNNINDWLIFGGVVWYLLEKISQKK